MSRIVSFEVITNTAAPEAPARDAAPGERDPAQWHQAIGIARDVCARIFRDGGTPADALAAFGLPRHEGRLDWGGAVERVAAMLCAQPHRRAA